MDSTVGPDGVPNPDVTEGSPGRLVGIFAALSTDRQAALHAYADLARQAVAEVRKRDLAEDDIIDEFESLRRRHYKESPW